MMHEFKEFDELPETAQKIIELIEREDIDYSLMPHLFGIIDTPLVGLLHDGVESDVFCRWLIVKSSDDEISVLPIIVHGSPDAFYNGLMRGESDINF